ncbi:sulfurtransferase TusA family protein, partial [Streptomyces sp. NPDC059398]|uniref:sulfurtransferase TusA family protein n=1 Tax=Streptomyces sp. NPDC059398 TaxID=3346820 RepID=UPI00367EEA73
SAEPGAEVSAEPGAEVSAEPGAEVSAEPGAEVSAEPGAEAGTRPEGAGAAEAGAGTGAGGGPVTGLVVDALGKRCPVPVIELAKVFGDVPVGGVVTVLSDDEAAKLDVPAWCEMRGQRYEGAHPVDGGTAFRVRRVS